MSIQIKCECGKTLKVSDEHAGKRGKCPNCGNIMLIREPEQESSEFEQEQTLQDMNQEEGTGAKEAESAFFRKEEDQYIGEKKQRSYAKVDGLDRRRTKNTTLILLLIAIIGLGTLFVLRPWETKIEPFYTFKKEDKKDVKKERVSEGLIKESVYKEDLSKSDDIPKPLKETRVENKEELKSEPSIDSISGVKSQVKIEEKNKMQTQISLATPPMQASGGYTVNLASFNKRQRAERYLAELDKQGIMAFIWSVDLLEKGTWYRVAIGKFLSYKEALTFLGAVEKELEVKPYITRIPSKEMPSDEDDSSEVIINEDITKTPPKEMPSDQE
ncbi:MAG: SPOR domain-containing protein [Thermodesulfobacteriota bacterium]|nr:SPOR domain-containing protein [Thermodesulfobacteriota bacterium]